MPIDYKNIKTYPFFNNEVQKIYSIVTSMVTLYNTGGYQCQKHIRYMLQKTRMI